MMRELDSQLTSLASKYGVRLHSPSYDQNKFEDEEKSVNSNEQGEE